MRRRYRKKNRRKQEECAEYYDTLKMIKFAFGENYKEEKVY